MGRGTSGRARPAEGPPASFAAAYASVRRSRELVAPFLTCPVTLEALHPGAAGAAQEPWLASDGHLYSAEGLRGLGAGAAGSGSAALRSPVTREVLRHWAVRAAARLGEYGFETEAATEPAVLTFAPELRPPFAPHVEARRGTRVAESWSDAFGSACRVALGWQDGDVVEWCFPVGSDGTEILTPPPARELLPLARPLARWLLQRNAYRNPEHVLTGWVRISRPALEGEEVGGAAGAAAEGSSPWRTFEELFLRLNRSGAR
jgi:hypothetical protein